MRVIAHRGASAAAPENTLAALRLGLQAGAAGAEIDVRVTSDGEVVLLHDATLDRTTDRRGALSCTPLRELEEADAGARRGAEWRGERVPRLAQLLDEWPRDRRLYIELKGGPALLAPLADVLRAHRGRDLVLLAFDPEMLRGAAHVLPGWPRVRNVEAPADGRDAWLAARIQEARSAGWAGLSFGVAAGWSAAWPARLHDAGLACAAWTVDDVELALELRRDGVDDLMTNDPGRVLRALEQ